MWLYFGASAQRCVLMADAVASLWWEAGSSGTQRAAHTCVSSVTGPWQGSHSRKRAWFQARDAIHLDEVGAHRARHHGSLHAMLEDAPRRNVGCKQLGKGLQFSSKGCHRPSAQIRRTLKAMCADWTHPSVVATESQNFAFSLPAAVFAKWALAVQSGSCAPPRSLPSSAACESLVGFCSPPGWLRTDPGTLTGSREAGLKAKEH